jgi:hypothetical protein
MLIDSTQQQHQEQRELGSSVFVADDAAVYDMPVSAINRPLQSQLDPAKVQQFVADMQAGATFTPIEVAHVTGLWGMSHPSHGMSHHDTVLALRFPLSCGSTHSHLRPILHPPKPGG